MADNRDRLPSADEIRASTNFFSESNALNKVVRIGGDIVVKYGRGVNLREAENLEFVAKNTSCPVPKCLATFKDSDTNEKFIVMSLAPGKQLDEMWPTMSAAERVDAGNQIKAALQSLRQLPAPDYLGTVGRNVYRDGIFWTTDNDPDFSGPFASESAFNEGLIRHLARLLPPPFLSLVRSAISSTLHGHKTCFTHGDLQSKNIMVHRTDTQEHGGSSIQVTIIDWEDAGWYPEYWEFCAATSYGRFKPDWLELALPIMEAYLHEFLMMELIQHVKFY